MKLLLLYLSIFSLILCEIDDQQIINININEELPLSTILFTTTNNIIYRLFDSGRNHNSLIYYNKTNGNILIKNNLDREELCSKHICSCIKCQLIIELIEWQIPYRILKLILYIEDINDHSPKFSKENYHFNLIENIPIGYELLLESAYDEDLGENNRISYQLNTFEKYPFELITKLNGDLILKVIQLIDREEKDIYQFNLIAYDHGQPTLSTSTNITIQIHDINDNTIILYQTYIHLHISENTPIGTELTSINATDKDIGINGKISYSIINKYSNDYFHINDSNGILTLINSVDYETEQFYHLIIKVNDHGENSLSQYLTIDITIIDENDNTPQTFITFVNPLINNSIISIIENTPIGQILGYISIYDQDDGLNGQISLQIQQDKQFIRIKQIHEKSFLLIINQLIDREYQQINTNKFILIISDHGKPSRSIELEYQISIIDLNDTPTIFNQTIQCYLNIHSLENQSFNQPLLKVHATDLDLNNYSISYSILPPYQHLFTINNQGEIFTLNSLNQSSYHLQILATDQEKFNSTHHCFITISTDNKFIKLNQSKYYYLILILILILIISLTFFYYKFRPNRTYHLYVTIPRKSLYINNEIPSDEFIHLNNDQESLSSSRTVHNNYLINSIKSSYNSQPVSISISTGTDSIS